MKGVALDHPRVCQQNWNCLHRRGTAGEPPSGRLSDSTRGTEKGSKSGGRGQNAEQPTITFQRRARCLLPVPHGSAIIPHPKIVMQLTWASLSTIQESTDFYFDLCPPSSSPQGGARKDEEQFGQYFEGLWRRRDSCRRVSGATYADYLSTMCL